MRLLTTGFSLDARGTGISARRRLAWGAGVHAARAAKIVLDAGIAVLELHGEQVGIVAALAARSGISFAEAKLKADAAASAQHA